MTKNFNVNYSSPLLTTKPANCAYLKFFQVNELHFQNGETLQQAIHANANLRSPDPDSCGIMSLLSFIHVAVPELVTFEDCNFDILAGLSGPVVGYPWIGQNKMEKTVLLI